MISNPTLLGTVQDVNGTSVSISLNSLHNGLSFVNGEGYRVGQVGSFVKIPIGYINLFGIISQIGASAIPETLTENESNSYRWIKVQLIGEGYIGGKFQRGISQYPTIDDEVHLVSEDDLATIYGEEKKNQHLIRVGNISGSASIDALIDINKLVTRHSALVGTTGSGKSTTVAGLLSKLCISEHFPSSRIIVLDLHGEYGKALKDKANIFKLNPDENEPNEHPLAVPFWALNADELLSVTFGNFGSQEKSRNFILEKILDYKRESQRNNNFDGLNKDNLSVDTPIPFSLNSLWYELYCNELGTYYSHDDRQPVEENFAYEEDEDGQPLRGNPEKGIPPRFKNPKNIAGDPEKINYIPGIKNNISRQLENLGAKLRLSRFDFLLNPGPWKPNRNGETEKGLGDLVKFWIGSNKPITILDLSGVPSSITNDIVGIILRILYDGLFWARNLSQGARERPLLVVMEEAHSYLNNNHSGLASSVVQRIVKEGRKYGIGAMIVSQRPSEIDSTILSQCGTFFALRLSNNTDRGYIKGAVTDNLDGLTSMLPILRTGEAIILGEAVKLPMRTIIEAPPIEQRPDSQDPTVCDTINPEDSMCPGGWNIKMESNPNYDEFVLVWRQQNPKLPNIINNNVEEEDDESMENYTSFTSSNVARIGYIFDTMTLEVEFNNGGIYQYFDFPDHMWEEFKAAESKGKYLHQNIKGHFRFTRI